MITRLPGLHPSDPEDKLSHEARLRINRALIESGRFVQEALIEIEERELETFNGEGELILTHAVARQVEEVLSARREEYSCLGLSDIEYRRIMEDEIDGAINHFGLSQSYGRLFRTRFFLQAPPEQSKSQMESLEFKHADDYSWVLYQGKKFELNVSQARIVQILDEARLKGAPSLLRAYVENEIDETDTELRDYFRKSPKNAKLWQSLIKNKNGRVWLEPT